MIMTQIKTLTAALLAASLALSCIRKEETPPALPALPFELQLTEIRQSATFTWDVAADGSTDNHQEQIKDLYVTAYNQVTLTSTQEVNVQSEDPTVVAVSGISPRSFRFEYKSDGATDIVVWNGQGEGRCLQRFRVYAKEFIDISGVLFKWYEYDSETRACTDAVVSVSHYKTSDFKVGNKADYYIDGSIIERESANDFFFDSDYRDWDLIYTFDQEGHITGGTGYGHVITFLGFEPENCSFRRISAFESEWKGPWDNYNQMIRMGFILEGAYSWPNERNVDKDVSEYAGVNAFLINTYGGARFYMAKIAVQANGRRYYYLYHRADGISDITPPNSHQG